MKGKRRFLLWALYTSLIAVGAAIAASLGWSGYLWDDPTHVTLLPLGVFIVALLLLGRGYWKLDAGGDPVDVWYAGKHCHYAASVCVSLGLIGTAVGYYLMLKHGHSGGDPEKVIDGAFANTSIAIVNTVFGAICGLLTELPSHFLMHAAKRAQDAAALATPIAAPMPPAAEPVMLTSPAPEDAP